MNSISSSKKLILDVTHFSLVLRTDVYRAWTFRDLFSRALSDPASVFKNVERLPLLNDINLKLYEGDRLGFLGVNGTGKTSLCRSIAGMYQPSRGKIQVHGEIRAIFDTSIGIQPELTGRENAELLAHFIFPNLHEQHQTLIDEALEFSELNDFLDVPYRLYSNGMQARLCLSMISSRPSDLLILDEVFEGADAFFREKISTRVLNMIEKSGAVIFVSHSFDQIEKVCNRLVVLNQGRIEFDGPVKEGIEIYKRLDPTNARK